MKLPNADTDSVISLQFQFTLQKNSTFILIKIYFSPSQDFSKYNLWTRADVPPDRHRS